MWNLNQKINPSKNTRCLKQQIYAILKKIYTGAAGEAWDI